MQNKIKILIVDDEQSARNSLNKIIDSFFSEYTVVGAAINVEDGLMKYQDLKPDIVLLDIEMPSKNGFDFVNSLKEPNCKIIFITAYNQYAIKAFKYSAIDYLLKPVDIDELGGALKRASSSINDINVSLLKEVFLEIRDKKVSKLAISSQELTEFVDIDSIVRLEAAGSYTNVFLSDGNKILATRILKDFEMLLDEDCFVRVHNSHLININYLQKFIKKDGYTVILQDGSKVPIAVRRKDDFEKILRKISR